MYGKDIERILSKIKDLQDETQNQLVSFTSENSYRIESIAQHAGTSFGQCIPVEKEHPASNPMNSIYPKLEAMEDDLGKIKGLGDNNYCGTSFNNSIGSPWDELEKMKSVINSAKAYADGNNPFNWVTQKASMLAHLNSILSHVVDAKYGLQLYQDYIQRGYDLKYNGKRPSIQQPLTMDKKGTGNKLQKYDENVNVDYDDNIDPF